MRKSSWTRRHDSLYLFFNIFNFFFLALIATLVTMGPVHAADPFAPADIRVTNTVLTQDVEPIGANLTTIAGGTNFAVNNHVWNSGFEPMMLRKFIRIDRAGANWFEWDSFGGPGYWNLAWTGLLNGATVHFYRIVTSTGQPLDYAGGTNMDDVTGAGHVVFLGESTIPLPGGDFPDGGYIANDDRFLRRPPPAMRSTPQAPPTTKSPPTRGGQAGTGPTRTIRKSTSCMANRWPWASPPWTPGCSAVKTATVTSAI